MLHRQGVTLIGFFGMHEISKAVTPPAKDGRSQLISKFFLPCVIVDTTAVGGMRLCSASFVEEEYHSKTQHLSIGQMLGSNWRSGRDSNPRTAFDRHTISNRARYDLFDTAAYSFVEPPLLCDSIDYYISFSSDVKHNFPKPAFFFFAAFPAIGGADGAPPATGGAAPANWEWPADR